MSAPPIIDPNLPNPSVAQAAAMAEALSAKPGIDAYGPVILPQTDAGASSLADAVRLCVLAEYGVIAVSGAEAIKFLNGQLTNDVAQLGPDAIQFNGYCTPKGRQLASMIEWSDGDTRRLAIARELAAPIAKRLSMYVLRAKAKVQDESAHWVALGLIGPDLAALSARLALPWPEPMHQARDGDHHLLRLGDVAFADAESNLAVPSKQGNSGAVIERAMLWLPLADAAAAVRTIGLPLSDSQAWRHGEIAAGTARITAATSEVFVPQMLNFDLIAGVSFKKGCYPGQEIVARTHYLGKLKRRTQRGETAAAGQPGDDIVAAASGEPCGKLLMSATLGNGRHAILFETQLAAIQNGSLSLAGQPIAVLPLPYDVPAV